LGECSETFVVVVVVVEDVDNQPLAFAADGQKVTRRRKGLNLHRLPEIKVQVDRFARLKVNEGHGFVFPPAGREVAGRAKRPRLDDDWCQAIVEVGCDWWVRREGVVNAVLT
jgi:hypothetical protein